MVSVYDFKNYRKFMEKVWESLPNSGHGQSKKLAEHLNVHTTLISQIFSGAKSFSPEQAILACDFFGLSENETDYFLLLVQLDRAGSHKLKLQIERQISQHQEKAQELVHRLQSKKQLSEEQRAIFYSDWSYSAIRQLTAISGFDSPESIANYLKLPIRRIREALQFLLESGLCIEEKGKVKIGPQSTHLESSSPWVRTHHTNWRLKAVENLPADQGLKLHYTCPMTLSARDAAKIRSVLVKMLEELDPIIEPSPSEELFCLNIDWFNV
jgi:uncharacterized protein (TIGR02147 family)